MYHGGLSVERLRDLMHVFVCVHFLVVVAIGPCSTPILLAVACDGDGEVESPILVGVTMQCTHFFCYCAATIDTGEYIFVQ